jgi:hypothetical protein
MKIELNLISKTLTIMAGFCAVLNGLIVGVSEESPLIFETILKPVNNYLLYRSNFY